MGPDQKNNQQPTSIEIYPTPTKGSLSQTADTFSGNTPQMEEKSAQNPRLMGENRILKLVLLFVFTIGYGFVFAFNPLHLESRSLVEGYIGTIPAILSPYIFAVIGNLIYKSVILLPAFIIVGWISRARWMIFVPILAYELTADGGLFLRARQSFNTDFFHYLSLHFLPQSTAYSHQTDDSFMIPFAYGLAFIVVLGCYCVISSRTNRQRASLVAAALLFCVTAATLGIIAKIGTPLYARELRTQDTILVAKTDVFFSNGSEVIYPPMQHLAGVYQNSDSITYRQIFPSNKRSIRENCSGTVQKTKSGHAYVSSMKAAYKSNDSTKGLQGEYTDFFYCFVIGSFKYTLSRSDGFDGSAYLQKYPAEDIIDAIYTGELVVLSCSSLKKSTNGSNGLDYCDKNSVTNARDILTSAEKKRTITCEDGHLIGVKLQSKCEQIISGGKTQSSARTDYKEVGRLAIPELGVSFPLTDETRDAYYIPGSTSDTVSIMLKKYESADCFKGKQFKSVGHV